MKERIIRTKGSFQSKAPVGQPDANVCSIVSYQLWHPAIETNKTHTQKKKTKTKKKQKQKKT